MSNKKTRYFVAISGAILAVGLGTGLVASYMGLPVSVFSSAAGPDELQYVPADAAVVAYANVREVMNSEFRQRFKDIEPSQNDKNEFEEKTGLNIEQDIDSVVAAVMPKDDLAQQPRRVVPDPRPRAVIRPRVSKRSPSSTARKVSEYQGKRLITHHDNERRPATPARRHGVRLRRGRPVAFGSLER